MLSELNICGGDFNKKFMDHIVSKTYSYEVSVSTVSELPTVRELLPIEFAVMVLLAFEASRERSFVYCNTLQEESKGSCFRSSMQLLTPVSLFW